MRESVYTGPSWKVCQRDYCQVRWYWFSRNSLSCCRSYQPGQEITVSVLVTANHKGYFTFRSNSDNGHNGNYITLQKSSPKCIFTGCAETTMWTETLTRCCHKTSKYLHGSTSKYLHGSTDHFVFHRLPTLYFPLLDYFVQSCFEEAQSLLQVAPSGDYR